MIPSSVISSSASTGPRSVRGFALRGVRVRFAAGTARADGGAGCGAEIMPRQCGKREQPQNQVPGRPSSPARRNSIGDSHSGHGWRTVAGLFDAVARRGGDTVTATTTAG